MTVKELIEKLKELNSDGYCVYIEVDKNEDPVEISNVENRFDVFILDEKIVVITI